MKAQVFFLVAVAALFTTIYASSHSEAPGTASIPNADITDLYVFRSYEPGREEYITFLLNVYPLQTPYGGPNYFSLSSDHFYEIYLDVNSDGYEDFTYQWMFGNALAPAAPHGYPLLFDDDGLCNELYTANTTPTASPNNISLGISLEINGNSIPIALKVAGYINGRPGASINNLNWEEYYSLRLITGVLTASPNRVVMERMPTGNPNDDLSKFNKPFDYAGQNSFGLPSAYESYSRQFIYDYVLNSSMMECPSDDLTGRVFVGQRSDPFWIALGRIFDYLNLIPVGLPQFSKFTIADCVTNNDLREKNIDTLALEVPISCFGTEGGGILNVWSGVRMLLHNPYPGELRNHLAGVQVSRLGNPLVNELVIGLIDKDRFSQQSPRMDADPEYGFGKYVLYPTLPEIISTRYLDAVNAILGTDLPTLAPSTPRIDLVNVFLTGIPNVNQGPGGFVGEVMRLNFNIPPTPINQQNNLGIMGSLLKQGVTGGAPNYNDFAGYPNGRRPGDDAVDISLMVVMGSLCYPGSPVPCQVNGTFPISGVPLTDGTHVQANFFNNYFPYTTTPTPGSYLDYTPGNVVQDPTKCYPGGQLGRCPEPVTCPTCKACTSCPVCPTFYNIVYDNFLFRRQGH